MKGATKLIIEVTAGVLPGEANPEFTRRWSLTSEEVKDRNLLSDTCGAASMYAAMMASPSHNNWVRHEWTWL